VTDFVALIPARLASTRLPNKPLADIAGKPMVVWVVEQALKAGARLVAVATDSTLIADAVRAHGYQAVMTRVDHLSGTDRLAQAAAILGLERNQIIVNVQGDEPLLPPAMISQVAAELALDHGCAMATAAHTIDSIAEYLNPNVVKVVLDHQRRAVLFARTDSLGPRPFSDIVRGAAARFEPSFANASFTVAARRAVCLST
jgi:3-deoxy-manno-octulosonate cytidylyltransferase (CMP-KDO synthetase)